MDSFVGYVLSGALTILAGTIGVCAWFGKKWMERIDASILSYGKVQHDCQVELPKTYQTKVDADADSTRLWSKVEDHGTRITRLETLWLSDGK